MKCIIQAGKNNKNKNQNESSKQVFIGYKIVC